MIFHITTEALFEKALLTDEYRHPSLQTEGFIHCSTKGQLQGVAQRFFQQVDELFILHLVEGRLPKGVLKWEGANDAEGLFPHIYGPIDVLVIEDVSLHARDENGLFDFTELPGSDKLIQPQ
jgi:uncharacterized protein (DUF952 family)